MIRKRIKVWCNWGIRLLLITLIVVMTSLTVKAQKAALKYEERTDEYGTNTISYIMNGKQLNPTKYPGYIFNGISLAPAKSLLTTKEIGASFQYKNKQIIIKKESTNIHMKLGSKKATINGKKVTLPLAPKKIKQENEKTGKVYIPARVVLESLGYQYTWYSEQSKVVIEDINKNPNTNTSSYPVFYNGEQQIIEESYPIYVNGQLISSTIPAMLLEGEIIVPIKEVFADTALQAFYEYNEDYQYIQLEWNQKKIYLQKSSDLETASDSEIAVSIAGTLDIPIYELKETEEIVFMASLDEIVRALGITYVLEENKVQLTFEQKQDQELEENNKQDTNQNTNENTNQGQITQGGTNSTEGEYSVKVKLPSSVQGENYTIYDNYWNRQLEITLQGDMTEFYKENSPEIIDSQIKGVTVSNELGNTKILIQTNEIKAFVLEEKEDILYIKARAPKEIYKKIVVIDAGHGGTDPGAGSGQLKESDITLKILLYVKQYLDQEPNIKVYYTRLADMEPTITIGSAQVPNKSASLKARYKMTNEIMPDMFFSIHVNSFEQPSAKGTETLYAKNNTYQNEGGLTSYKLAEIAHDYMIEVIMSTDRGIKDRSQLAVLKNAKVPAVLIETAFISNEQDRAKLQSEEVLEEIGAAVYKTILEAYELYPVN